jgi:hypothetical protein
MRIAKMPHVRYDKVKRRHYIEKRVPKDIIALTGCGRFKYHTFQQHVSEQEANDQSIEVIRGWERGWEELRHGADPEKLAADLIEHSRRHDRPFRRYVSDSTLALVHEAGAHLGIALTVPSNRREAVHEIVGRHFEKAEAHRKVLNALVAEVRSALAQPTDLAVIRERLLAAVADAPVDDHPLVECEEVLISWAKERSIAVKSLRQRREIMRAFFDWHHKKETKPKTPLVSEHFDMAKIREPDLIRYRAHLVASIGDDYIDVTAKKELADLRTIFTYAHDDMKVLKNGNPAAKIKNIKALDNTRDALEPHERDLLICEAVKSKSPIIKWGNLFGGFLGITLAEIAEIQTTDFEERQETIDGVATSVLVMKIRDKERKKENPNQRTKTKERVRRLPVPEPIIRAGFQEYLAWVIETYGHGPLFPMVKKDQDGRRNTYASNEIAEWLNKLIPDEEKTFHSWRQTVRSMLENIPGCSSDRARWIVGHAPRDIDATNYLKHPIPHLVAVLGKLNDPLAA